MDMNIFNNKPTLIATAPLSTEVFIGVGAGIILLIVLVVAFVLRKMGKGRVYEFPLSDSPKRLGAEHAAGVGAVIAFQSHSLPPSEQRNKESEFLSDI